MPPHLPSAKQFWGVGQDFGGTTRALPARVLPGMYVQSRALKHEDPVQREQRDACQAPADAYRLDKFGRYAAIEVTITSRPHNLAGRDPRRDRRPRMPGLTKLGPGEYALIHATTLR